MTSIARKHHSIADTELMEDRDEVRYELWHGQPHAMTGGTAANYLITVSLFRVLDGQLDLPCVAFMSDMAVQLRQDAYSDKAYPDVMVVCDPLPGRVQTAPVLLAEVLSESSVQRDRTDKMNAYKALTSCQVYLIVNQTAQYIEVYRRGNGWRQEDYLSGIIELNKPKLRIDLPDVYDSVKALGFLI